VQYDDTLAKLYLRNAVVTEGKYELLKRLLRVQQTRHSLPQELEVAKTFLSGEQHLRHRCLHSSIECHIPLAVTTDTASDLRLCFLGI